MQPSATRKNGFTLSEVLVTVTILVILSMTVLIGLNPLIQIFRGYDARRKSDLYKLKNAFESYYVDHDCYPATDVLQMCGSNILDPYLKVIPCDPQDGTPYSLTLIPSDSVCPQQYAIYSTLMRPGDSQANIPDCPQIMAVTSPNMSYVDIVEGCSAIELCPAYYGCSNGMCTSVARDRKPTCAPNYCDPDCGGVNCAKKVRGKYVNECVAF